MEKKLENLTKKERKLLMMFEETEVDNYGIIENPRLMTVEDFNIADRWNTENFILFEKIPGEDLEYRITLSDEAWRLAHEERKAKSKRMKDYKLNQNI